jgi:membrane-bound hydrogenase subunit mbhJ
LLYTRWRRALPRPATDRFPAVAAAGLFPPDARPVEVLRTAPPGRLATSLAIRHIDVGSCGGPESELSLLTAPPYDISRFGFTFTPSPRHADLLLVTGSLTAAMEPLLRETYEAMPAPRRVVVVGACGAWAGCALARGPEATAAIARVVPVDVFVPGCPPAPAAVMAGLFAAVGRWAPGLRGWVTLVAPAHGSAEAPARGGGRP